MAEDADIPSIEEIDEEVLSEADSDVTPINTLEGYDYIEKAERP